MSLSRETVKEVAHLARIDLTEEELATFSAQLKGIVDFIDILRELDVNTVPPTSHILALRNVLRADARVPSLPGGDALANAPEKQGALFAVPRILE